MAEGPTWRWPLNMVLLQPHLHCTHFCKAEECISSDFFLLRLSLVATRTKTLSGPYLQLEKVRAQAALRLQKSRPSLRVPPRPHPRGDSGKQVPAAKALGSQDPNSAPGAGAEDAPIHPLVQSSGSCRDLNRVAGSER